MVSVWMTFSDLQPRFQGHDYSGSNNSKMVQHRAIGYLQWPSNRKSYMVYRTAPFSMTLNDPFISQKRYDIHSFNGILIGTYTRPTQQCHCEWSWVILSDLAKYSVIRSVARSLCYSWASAQYLAVCCCLHQCGAVMQSSCLRICPSQTSTGVQRHVIDELIDRLVAGVKRCCSSISSPQRDVSLAMHAIVRADAAASSPTDRPCGWRNITHWRAWNSRLV